MKRAVFNYSIFTTWDILASFAVLIPTLVLSLAWLFPTLSSGAAYSQLLSSMPEQLRRALGVVGDQNTYFGFLSANYFNSLHLYFLIAFTILLVQRLISKPISDTSLGYFLDGTLTRTSYFLTRFIFFVTASFAIALISVVSTVAGQLSFDPAGRIQWQEILVLNAILFLVFLFLGALTILIRVISRSGTFALSVSSVVIVMQYVMGTMSTLGAGLGWLRYATVFSLIDVHLYVTEPASFAFVAAIAIIGTGLLVALSAMGFKRKDLFL